MYNLKYDNVKGLEGLKLYDVVKYIYSTSAPLANFHMDNIEYFVHTLTLGVDIIINKAPIPLKEYFVELPFVEANKISDILQVVYEYRLNELKKVLSEQELKDLQKKA